MSHKTPANIISRINYRLAHNVLSLASDDEWLLKDAVFVVLDLVAEIESLKAQGINLRNLARKNRELKDLITKIEIQRDTAVKDSIRLCETNNHNARMYGECKNLLQKHGIHLVSKECWCNPTTDQDCFQPPEDLKKIYATIGGKLSKRKITPEQQAKMQAGRKTK